EHVGPGVPLHPGQQDAERSHRIELAPVAPIGARGVNGIGEFDVADVVRAQQRLRALGDEHRSGEGCIDRDGGAPSRAIHARPAGFYWGWASRAGAEIGTTLPDSTLRVAPTL